MNARRPWFVCALVSLALSCARGAPSEELQFPPAGAEWPRAAEPAKGSAALERALAYAGAQRSSGVVVVRGGLLVVERYWTVEGAGEQYDGMRFELTPDGRTIEDVASVQKSVASFLAGVAIGRGLLDAERPVAHYLGAGWSRATPELEAAILVRHLLSMSSGLSDQLTFDAPAGSQWRYNTTAYSRLLPLLEKAAGKPLQELTEEWLLAPTGMLESGFRKRPWAEQRPSPNAIGFATSARDLARFGLLCLARGQWAGRDQLGNRSYFDQALAPSQPHNPSYGWLWWLNGQSEMLSARGERRRPGPLFASAPGDAYAAQGALDRRLYVVPSLELVVTRLGAAAEPGFDERFLELLLASFE